MNSSDEKSQQYNELLVAFLSDLTHEVGTPLGMICAYSELLLAEKTDPLTDNQRESIEKINYFAHKTRDVLWDHLRLTNVKLSLLHNETHAIDLISVLNEILQNLQSDLDVDEQTIQLDTPETIPNVMALRPILYELLFQLIKTLQSYTVSGEQILLSVTLEEKAVKTSISTNSFSPDKSKGNYWLHSRIGIIHRSIKQFGGEFGEESEEGKGSTIWFTLPIANEPAEQG